MFFSAVESAFFLFVGAILFYPVELLGSPPSPAVVLIRVFDVASLGSYGSSFRIFFMAIAG